MGHRVTPGPHPPHLPPAGAELLRTSLQQHDAIQHVMALVGGRGGGAQGKRILHRRGPTQ